MNQFSCIKSVPVADLQVVAIVVQFKTQDATGQDNDGRPYTETELEVLDAPLRAAAAFEPFANRCDCCGSTRLRYACEVVHVPSKIGYYVGRDCADKIACLAGESGKIEGWCVALAERVKARRRVASWVAQHSEHAAILSWAEKSSHSIANDIAAKLARYGDLSEAQVALLYRLKLQGEEKAAAAALEPKPTTPAPEGRVEVCGEILHVKSQEGFYGTTVLKMLVRLTDHNKVWVTVPADCCAEKGEKIAFKATFERSEKDEHFSFGKRPTLTKTEAA